MTRVGSLFFQPPSRQNAPRSDLPASSITTLHCSLPTHNSRQLHGTDRHHLSLHLLDGRATGRCGKGSSSSDSLPSSLSTLFQDPSSPHNLPELLGTIYEDPETANLTIKVTPSSSIPSIVGDRSSDVRFSDLRPELSFPLRPLEPSNLGAGLTVPPPDATKGVEALWVQLTFIEGGFVIHLRLHCWIAGADSAARFDEVWFERARLLATGSMIGDDTDGLLLKCMVRFHDRQQLTNTLASNTSVQLDHPDLLHVPGGRRVWAGIDLPPIVLLIIIRFHTFLMTYLPFLLP